MNNAEAKFANILKALDGVTILEQPRVSRETIVATLREHTNFLREIRLEISDVSQTNKQVSQEAAENRMYITQLREDSAKQQKGLDNLLRISDDLRRQVSSISNTIDDMPAIKQNIIEQKAFMQDVALKFHAHVSELNEFVGKTNKSIDKIEQKHVTLQAHVKEIEIRVDHYHESLILPASQVKVETTAGFSDRPMSLIEVLGICNSNFDHIQNNNVRLDQRLAGHDDELGKKAPESIIFQVNNIERKVAAVEFVLEREEDQGVNAVRRQCEQLTSDVQSITAELHDKIDKDAVSLIVHEKYDEIVRYLQDALQSSSEDEQNFKAKSDELQGMLLKLANSKCDRVEIIPMQEMLVKTEAMLRKLALEKSASNSNSNANMGGKDITMRPGGKGDNASGSGNMIVGNNYTYSKKEIEAMLELKVDKDTFEQQLQSMMKLAKKARRLSSVLSPTSGAGSIYDQAMAGTGSAGSDLILDSHQRDQMLWKSLADVARDESDAALLKSQIVNKMAAGRQNMNLSRSMSIASTPSVAKTMTISSSSAKVSSSQNPYNRSHHNLASINTNLSSSASASAAASKIRISGPADVGLLSSQYSGNQSTSGKHHHTSSNLNLNLNVTLPSANIGSFGGVIPMNDESYAMPMTDDVDFRSPPRNVFTPQVQGQEQMYAMHDDSIIEDHITQQISSSPTHYVQGRSLLPANEHHRPAGRSYNGSPIPGSIHMDDTQYIHHPSGQYPIDINMPLQGSSMLSDDHHHKIINSSSAMPDRMISTSNGGSQDLSYLGAQVAGGGFNLKTGNITKPQTLKATSGFADGSQDLEAAGFLVKGQDGKMYYTDTADDSAANANVYVPTAKKLVPSARANNRS